MAGSHPKLDYVPRLDRRNKRFRVASESFGDALWGTRRYWTPGVVLDQEPVRTDPPHYDGGGCVGHGTVGEAVASPVRVPVPDMTSGDRAADAHRLAVDVYERCKEIDEFEGVDEAGTSVRAGMLVARERGWNSGFNWAFNLFGVRVGLETGPIVVGIQVLERMWDTEPNGDWVPEGREVGWHCVYLHAYSPDYYGRGARLLGVNSWSRRWGVNGRFAIRPNHLNQILFEAGGEAAVATGRAL